MYLEDYRAFVLSLPATSESLPFDNQTLVFKVLDKMFALTDMDEFKTVNLKCDPERALELREKHPFVQPGYHMNKKHWNTLHKPSQIEEDFLKELTQHSYQLVISKMTKAKQNLLNNL